MKILLILLSGIFAFYQGEIAYKAFHSHGVRSHTHPLPHKGVEHRHGNGEPGSFSKSSHKKLSMKTPPSNITGYLDALYQEHGRFYIRGWACQRGTNKSINVHAYVNGSADEGGTYVFQGKADQVQNSHISKLCNTVNTPHRFVIQIPERVLHEHEGNSILIHGQATSERGRLSKALKITNHDRYTFNVPSAHPSVEEITDLKFHPLHYYSDAKSKVVTVTNGQIYNRAAQSKVSDYKFSLSGAHSVASSGGDTIFAAKTMLIKRGGKNNILRDSEGDFIKSRVGAIVQVNITEGKVVASYSSNTSYPLFSPHDIIFNRSDQYYYYIDSHWYSSADYLVRFQSDGKRLINSEAVEINNLYPNQNLYARSLSLYDDGIKQKIIIGVSSHGEAVLVDSFSDSLLKANFEVKRVTNKKRQYIIDKNGPSGSYNTTGFVFNDIEFYKGYFYGTNFFASGKCQIKGCADEFRFVRWKTWDDFEKDNVEDLSYLIQKKRIPYYISIANEKLYLATIPDIDALSNGEKMEPKIYVMY